MTSTMKKRSYSRDLSKVPVASPPSTPSTPVPLTGDALVDLPIRELILLCGKDGKGKTSALVSLAHYFAEADPARTIWVLDTEGKYRSILRGFGPAPANIRYFAASTMNDVTAATRHIVESHTPGDWLCIESLHRIWEKCQDLGYNAINGLDKAEYLEARRAAQRNGGSVPPVTPKPDQLWNVAKGALNGGFLDLLTDEATNPGTLNVVMTAPLSKVNDRFDKKEAQEVRAEAGIDMNIAGPPALPYLVETLCVLEGDKNGDLMCRVVRDNLSMSDDPRKTFPVPDRRQWFPFFLATCREEGA